MKPAITEKEISVRAKNIKVRGESRKFQEYLDQKRRKKILANSPDLSKMAKISLSDKLSIFIPIGADPAPYISKYAGKA